MPPPLLNRFTHAAIATIVGKKVKYGAAHASMFTLRRRRHISNKLSRRAPQCSSYHAQYHDNSTASYAAGRRHRRRHWFAAARRRRRHAIPRPIRRRCHAPSSYKNRSPTTRIIAVRPFAHHHQHNHHHHATTTTTNTRHHIKQYPSIRASINQECYGRRQPPSPTTFTTPSSPPTFTNHHAVVSSTTITITTH